VGKNGDGSMLPEGLKKKSASQSSPATGGPNYTTGAPYDPQDMYSTAGYSAYALYNRGHCCNPTGNAGVTPPQTSIAIATAGSQQVSDMAGFQGYYPVVLRR
jgi:hypothetical protein